MTVRGEEMRNSNAQLTFQFSASDLDKKVCAHPRILILVLILVGKGGW